MGNSRWNAKTYRSYTNSIAGQSVNEVYSRSSIDDYLNPSKIEVRESRDSEQNPESTPIIIGLDVTGSMEFIPDNMVRDSLGTLMDKLLEKRPIPDPHILFMGIGDAVRGDRAPLQVTQFEADTIITEQLTNIYIEKGGGGNGFESYDLAWGFASRKTQSDAWDKRQKKGYLFTIGDEGFPKATNFAFFNDNVDRVSENITPKGLLEEAQERYHVFHIVVEEGDYARRRPTVVEDWKSILGKRALPLSDHRHISEVILTAISVSEGMDIEKAIASWPSEIQNTVKRAIT